MGIQVLPVFTCEKAGTVLGRGSKYPLCLEVPLFLLVLAFDSSSCVQSTLIFSLNFHLIGEWHDKRELVQLNGLIETESTEAALKRTHLQQNKKGRDNSHFGSGKKTFSNLWPFGQNDIISVSAKRFEGAVNG